MIPKSLIKLSHTCVNEFFNSKIKQDMSDSEDEEVQSRTVKITVVGETATGKVSKIAKLF